VALLCTQVRDLACLGARQVVRAFCYLPPTHYTTLHLTLYDWEQFYADEVDGRAIMSVPSSTGSDSLE
jgi:hypothetical protein